ncbi:MAG: ribonuclease R [Geminicoccaceae bacterium]
MPRGQPAATLPTRDEILRWLEQTPAARKRDVLEAFAVGGKDKVELKRLLRELERDGEIDLRRRKPRPDQAPAAPGKLPPVGVVDVVAIDDQGDLVLRSPDLPDLQILLPTETLENAAPAVGDRLLAKLRRQYGGHYEARLIKVLPQLPKEIVGILAIAADGYRLRSADRKAKTEFRVSPRDVGDAGVGDLVRCQVLPGRRLALPQARVVERLGSPDDPKALSLMVAVQAELPMVFATDALEQAAAAVPVELGRRTDLRHLDLVTIDGEDARDFDDAVWATADTDPANPEGHRAFVAIADVAWYVRPGDALDRAARERGNSVYFPDRVIPMLPEALSNDLCSLRPDGDRACLAVEMRFDRNGKLFWHRFHRGLMRSRARLTYTQVQAAIDGQTDELTAPLLEPVIRPLYAVYEVLAAARRKRGTIELDLPERRVILDDGGNPVDIRPRQRVAAHMLIEELMIAANVAAAQALEAANEVCLYRVHDKPDPQRLEALAQFLERLGVPWSATANRPGDFTRLLERLADHELREMIASFVLRAQAQAIYTPRNIGHFGLHLKRYAHFTSPIRRYSDLVVHRALIRAFKLGEGPLPPDVEQTRLDELGQHLSRCERRSMEAERRALERYVALFMADRAGSVFAGRVTGVQRFGLFVTLDETGADGLVPVSSLGDDAFVHDERHHALVGQRYGESFGLGDVVRVLLAEVDTLTGSLSFRLESHERARGAELARTAWRKGQRGPVGRRGGPPRGRRR